MPNCRQLAEVFRITAAELVERPWLCHYASYPCWPDETALATEVAQNLKERLKLVMSASNVLCHVRQRPFHSTGGCFNLMMSQRLRKSSQYKVPALEGKYSTLTTKDPTSPPVAMVEEPERSRMCEETEMSGSGFRPSQKESIGKRSKRLRG